MQIDERAVQFDCGGARLFGVISAPAAGPVHRRGVLIVVGGPQYRAGSHRQFTLLARHLAGAGIAAMRFDYRGMGDSEGAPRSFEDAGADIDAALGHFMEQVPALGEVAIWGLCDGASAALLHAAGDARVTGLALLNPWAHTEQGHAKAVLRHYYWARLRDPAFWRKLAGGGVRPGVVLASMAALVRNAAGRAVPGAQPVATEAGTPASAAPARATTASATPARAAPAHLAGTLPQRLQAAMAAYRGRLLLVTCDTDLTAQEFMDMAASPAWQKLLRDPRVQQRRLAEADHTCSRREWRDQVAQWTATWLKSW